ncbi:hypothetical protein [Streptomyces orinoci]|uniref:Uncharacterized protein n=1 Tax=Streptomyces orinoci TaxID=67339 RepID=A0ABV3K7S6_STRON|nr:hypothetical protein [Streptomyces orinoci]
MPPAEMPAGTPAALWVARAQGVFNLVGGGWPLLHLRSFAWVFGPKHDEWLQKASAGLFASSGWSLLRAPATAEGLAQARRIGVGAALTYLAVDLCYVPRRRIRPTYLLDAAMEIGWLTAWWRATRKPTGSHGQAAG